jgi:endonuclease/exonuclease/phosphatase family metal-dependent hydrolase
MLTRLVRTGFLLFTFLGVCAAHATQTLTIGTYNIHGGVPNGFSSANYDVRPCDVRNIADVISSAGAEIVGLQEVKNEWQMRKGFERNILPPDIARTLAFCCKMNFVFGSTIRDVPGYPANTNYMEWGSAEHWSNNGPHGEFGNAVLSRYPLAVLGENYPLPFMSGEEQRACLRVQYDVPQSAFPLVVYATHLHHQGGAARERQMRAILDRAKTETSTATVFILGDLNSHPGPKEPDLMGMAAHDGFTDIAAQFASEQGASPLMTFPADKADRRIDYILSSRKLRVLDVRTPETTASDHLPLFATVELP